METKLFIWHNNNFSLRFARELREIGFNAWRIPVEPFWSEVSEWGVFGTEEKQKFVAAKMYALYEELKKIGYEFFIIDAGWGLGALDYNNYFFKIIYSRFENCPDVLFDWGEFYEDYVETKKYTLSQYWLVRNEREQLMKDRLCIGATARNKVRLRATSLTSYLNQNKYWCTSDKYAWIFGQAAWHNLIGSLCYKTKARQLKNLGVNIIGLYQGNPADWSAIGWENKLMKLLRLKEKFERWQRFRFIKSFEG